MKVALTLTLLKKWWPSIAHAAIVLVGFLDPAVRAFAGNNAKYAAIILLVWGWVLHWLTSPKNAETIAAVKVIETPPQSVENAAAEKAIQKAEDSAK